ncbi:MAG: NUDIX domain-containing protein [Fibrobacteraceae bacterium]|nr:NUDIX domain-containing protein [Fibrobacteraceae bacterium]
MEEQIDILNPDGSFAGYACGRTEVHAKGFWHRTVHIWAFDGNGRVLFQLRAKVKENNPGLLDTSCAGHIGAGDNSRSAGLRELHEELGVKKRLEDLQYLFESGHQSVLNGGSYLDNEFYDTYKIILSDEDVAGLRPQPGEVDDFVWMTVEEFIKMHKANPEKFVDHPKDYQWLKDLI